MVWASPHDGNPLSARSRPGCQPAVEWENFRIARVAKTPVMAIDQAMVATALLPTGRPL